MIFRTHTTLLVAFFLYWVPSHAQTWKSQTSNTTRFMNAVAFLNTSNIVAVGQSGYIIYSTNGGTGWTEVHPTSQELNSVSFSGSTVIALGSKVVRSTDSGVSWAEVYSAPSVLKKATASFIDATTVLAVGAGGTIVRNTNSGAAPEWAQVDGGVPPNRDLNAISFSGNIVVTVGDRAGGPATTPYNIVRNNSKGAPGSWSNVGPASGTDLYEVAFIGANTVVAVGKDGVILRSTLSGQTGSWSTPTVDNNPGEDLNILAVNGTSVVATGTNGVIMYSHNSGADWDRASVTNDPGQTLNAVAASSSLMVAVGTGGTILSSTNNGTTWTPQTSPTGVDLLGVDIINPIVIVGQNGTVLTSSTQVLIGGGGSSSGSQGFQGTNQVIDARFGGEWLLALLVLGYGLYRIR